MSTAIAPEGIRGKVLDANRYATKKTIAQGMLDIALLTANASQLKYILQVGKEHEFYTLMVTLISISIILQVTAATLFVVLSLLDIRQPERRYTALAINHAALGCVMGSMVSDVVKMSFTLDLEPLPPAVFDGLANDFKPKGS